MSQFYAEIQGNRGKTSRMGSKMSGMWSHTRGWGVGVEVQCWHTGGEDVIEIQATGGSNGGMRNRRLVTLRKDPNGEGLEITVTMPNGQPSVTYTI